MKKTLNLFVLASALILSGCGKTPVSSDVSSSGSSNDVPTTSENDSSGSSAVSSESSSEAPYIPIPSSWTPSLADQTLPEPELTEGAAYKLATGEYLAGSTFKDVRLSDGAFDPPATGNLHVLVIPVEFTDAPAKDLPAGEQGTIAQIHKLFNGGPGTNSWHSVKEFYYRSSYGKLNIEATISDTWYNSGMSMLGAYQASLVTVGEEKQSTYASGLVRNAVENYRARVGEEAMKKFDGNGDGYLDAVYLVNSAEIRGDIKSSDDDNFFWAYVSNAGGTKSVTRPGANRYMFASWKFMWEAGRYVKGAHKPWTYPEMGLATSKPDAHTFIHETGHILGLEDYYTYDSYKEDWAAMGGLDMMDYNVGDHNAWSKWMLDWVEPIVVTNTTTVKIRPSTLYGDAIVLAPDYKKNQSGEYIVLEYYRPEGVNDADSSNPYGGNYPLLYSEAGIKAFHVDARTANYEYTYATQTTTLIAYVDAVDTAFAESSTEEVFRGSGLAHYNTATQSLDPNIKLIEVLEAGHLNSLRQKTAQGYTNLANNSFLFQAGDGFGVTTFVNYKLHSGTALGFSFTVDSIDETGATITITKL